LSTLPICRRSDHGDGSRERLRVGERQQAMDLKWLVLVIEVAVLAVQVSGSLKKVSRTQAKNQRKFRQLCGTCFLRSVVLNNIFSSYEVILSRSGYIVIYIRYNDIALHSRMSCWSVFTEKAGSCSFCGTHSDGLPLNVLIQNRLTSCETIIHHVKH